MKRSIWCWRTPHIAHLSSHSLLIPSTNCRLFLGALPKQDHYTVHIAITPSNCHCLSLICDARNITWLVSFASSSFLSGHFLHLRCVCCCCCCCVYILDMKKKTTILLMCLRERVRKWEWRCVLFIGTFIQTESDAQFGLEYGTLSERHSKLEPGKNKYAPVVRQKKEGEGRQSCIHMQTCEIFVHLLFLFAYSVNNILLQSPDSNFVIVQQGGGGMKLKCAYGNHHHQTVQL